jgi:cytoskeletal protein CcmA (bactofilin family)
MMMKKRLCGLIVFLLFLAVFSAEPAVASWQRLTGEEIFLREGETTAGDLWVFGRTVEIHGRIKGDLLIIAEELVISGTVEGDVLGVVGRATVSGGIEGDFRGLVAIAQLDGMILGNLSLLGTELVLGPKSKTGSVLSRYTIAQLLGEITSSASLQGGYCYFNGKLDGDLQVGGQAVVGENAVIAGDIIYPAEVEPVIKAGSKVGGIKRPLASTTVPVMTWLQGLWFMGSLLLGLVWLLLFPQRWYGLLSSKISWLRTVGFGLGGSLLLPLFSILASFTVIGLPLGIGLFLLFLAIVLLGELPVFLLVGRWFYRLFGRKNRVHRVLLFVTGGFVLTFLKLLPVIGFFIGVFTRVLGNGLFLTYFVNGKPKQAESLQS